MANIDFAEWAGMGQVRQASCKGRSEDKPARELYDALNLTVLRRASNRLKGESKCNEAEARLIRGATSASD